MHPFVSTTRDLLGAELPEMPRPLTRIAARLLVWLSAPLAHFEQSDRLARLPDPVIFAFNHNNSIESVLVPALLIFHRRGRIVRFLADWMYLHVPGVGWLLRQVEPIPVYTKPARFRLFESYRQRRRQATDPVQAAVACLAAGTSLGIFPEGTRNRSASHLRRARGGLARIVLASAAPVVPVGIYYPAKDRLGRIPRLGRFEVRLGEPLLFAAERAAGDGRAITAQVMAHLAVLSAKNPARSRAIRQIGPASEPAGRKS